MFNLRANSEITIELGDEQFMGRVVELSDQDARGTVQSQAGVSEQFAQYVESAAPREIPAGYFCNPG